MSNNLHKRPIVQKCLIAINSYKSEQTSESTNGSLHSSLASLEAPTLVCFGMVYSCLNHVIDEDYSKAYMVHATMVQQFWKKDWLES